MIDDIISFLENEAVVYFKVKKGNCGLTDKKRTIWLNPNEDILPTVIHEAIHCLRNDWSEKKVRKEEERICKKLTINQWQQVFRAINLKG